MLPELCKKVQEILDKALGMVIAGLATVESIDSSGELVSIKGMDLTNFHSGTVLLNVEHISPKDENKGSLESIIGHCLYAKKIYKEEDCEDKHQLELYKKWELPCLYMVFELYDSEKHQGALNAAAILRYYKKRDMMGVPRFSVEGTTLERDPNKDHVILQSILKKVALTMSPCCHASIVEVLRDSEAEISKAEDTNRAYKFFYPNEPDIVVDPLLLFKNALNDLKGLNKALTLGGGDVAPGALVGGSALAKENVDSKEHRIMLKNQILAAFRDWDRVSEFKTFLKHRIPNISEDFVQKFSDLTEVVNLKKTETIQPPRPSLKKLDTRVPPGSVSFKGKKVLPGEIELVSGPFQDSKLKLLGLDDKYVYVNPFKASDQQEVKINKIPRLHEGHLFVILKDPETLNVPNFVDAEQHGDPLNSCFDQQALIHGLDMASEPLVQSHPNGSTEARSKGIIGWFKSAHDKYGYVKPAVNYFGNNDKEALNPNKPGYLSTAKREVVFYNVAKAFWGLGEAVPPTALFKHPDTQEDHSVMQLVDNANHFKMRSLASEHHDGLGVAGDTGYLQKLAIMDVCMGSADRERVNYLINDQYPYVHLIDNALCLNYNDDYVPAYLHDYYHLKQEMMTDAIIQPEVRAWLIGLDPFILAATLQSYGVDPQLANSALVRLIAMQSAILMGTEKITQILFAYSHYASQEAQGVGQI
jgi:hypothetical protein